MAQKMFDLLKPFEVKVPATWRRITRPNKRFPCKSFERSFHFAVEFPLVLAERDPTAKFTWLVHGEQWGCQRQGWVELPGDVVFDGVLQRFYDRGKYYETVYAAPWYMYSPGAAILISEWMPEYPDGTILLANWHTHLRLPWADPKNPARIGSQQAFRALSYCGLMDAAAS